MQLQVTNDWKSYILPAGEAKKPNGAMGKDDFLKLLFTQLKYQDPQNPVDDREFAAQLAQFSTLEQMTNMSASVNELKTVMERQGKYSLLQAVGKTARAEGDGLVADVTGERKGIFTLSADASAVMITITDGNGTPLRTLAQGAARAGENVFRWDGILAGGGRAPEGPYRFFVEATDANGQPVPCSTFMQGTVTGVTLDADPAARIGDFTVPFEKIRMLKG